MANITQEQKQMNFEDIIIIIRSNYLGITTTELASELNMSKRTIWRYLDILRSKHAIYQDSIYWFFDRESIEINQ